VFGAYEGVALELEGLGFGVPAGFAMPLEPIPPGVACEPDIPPPEVPAVPPEAPAGAPAPPPALCAKAIALALATIRPAANTVPILRYMMSSFCCCGEAECTSDRSPYRKQRRQGGDVQCETRVAGRHFIAGMARNFS
jgi:hypothetical protein